VTGSTRASLLDEVRSACARVAERARFVHIQRDRLEAYARQLPVAEIAAPPALELPTTAQRGEARAAFVLALDAVNFGSGYFPQLRKSKGLSGYRTLEARLRNWFEREGPPTPAALRGLDAETCARIFDQPLGNPAVAELMQLYARALSDLGEFVGDDFGAPLRASGGSAERLVQSLLEMPLYRDVSEYAGVRVPFLKRAQLTVQDLAAAGAAEFSDLDRLTIFADNLVPHVLRLDGVLQFDADLVERIDAGRLLEPGSPEEVEIRACAVHAVEMLASDDLPPRLIDAWLWWRGARPEYKAHPRHRCRCTYY
jgi:hypothetical protein